MYIARRAVRMASEDIGNADPRALTMSLEACAVYERLGSPEGELAIAQAIVFMACAAKSNAVYTAFGAAMEDATKLGSLEVPLHLRNAPTRLMKEIGYGKGYRYAHDEPDGYAAGERYLPEGCPSAATMCPRRAASRSRSARRWRRGARETRASASKLAHEPEGTTCSIPSCYAPICRRWPPSWRAAASTLDVERIARAGGAAQGAQIEADGLRAERNANAKATGQAKAQGRDATALIELGESRRATTAAVEGRLEPIQAELFERAIGLAEHPACQRAAGTRRGR